MIGKNIHEIRRRRGLTLSELAERANISKSYLSNIERNLNQNPSVQVIERLAAVLDVELYTLLSTDKNLGSHDLISEELIQLVNELKDSGIKKDQLNEYKTIIEYIKWKSQQ